jgi:hypothetical protein
MKKIHELLKKQTFPETEKSNYLDGKTGQPFRQNNNSLYQIHDEVEPLVEDKIHALSRAYSLVTHNHSEVSSTWWTEIRRNGAVALEAYDSSRSTGNAQLPQLTYTEDQKLTNPSLK